MSIMLKHKQARSQRANRHMPGFVEASIHWPLALYCKLVVQTTCARKHGQRSATNVCMFFMNTRIRAASRE